MEKYCDKCKKSDKDEVIVKINYVKVNTDKLATDITYFDNNPNLCKKCYEEFKMKLESLLKQQSIKKK